MCQLLKVGRSSYYDWLRAKPSARSQEQARSSAQVKAIFNKHQRHYGSRRIQATLVRQGHIISHRQVAQLMKQQSLVCQVKRKYHRTTDSNHSWPIAQNLLNRTFSPPSLDQVYVGDTTYIPTQQGWLYHDLYAGQ